MADQSSERMDAIKKTLVDSGVKGVTQQNELNKKFLTGGGHLQPKQPIKVGFGGK